MILPRVLVAGIIGRPSGDPAVGKVRQAVAAKLACLPILFQTGASLIHLFLCLYPRGTPVILRRYAGNIRSLCWFVYLDAEKSPPQEL
jgi:hypothetical protein